ncbi:MAG: GMC family oxidoreductase [Rhodocyclaceae bacterium]
MAANPYIAGLAAGWRISDASRLTGDLHLEADVIVVGTGAGGGIAAEILSAAGLEVVMVEEGPLRSTRDFRMREEEAYPDLYQDSAARKTRDKSINILQGRCVGGSTTVNWASCFRTPEPTLRFWGERFGLADFNVEDLRPWFEAAERRLGIHDWTVEPNANNDVLRLGASRLGLPASTIHRNVRGCWNLGYCGLGCPTNAKQSMLITAIPAALGRGASLLTRVRAQRVLVDAGKAVGVECAALASDGILPGPQRVIVRARHVVLAAGAIGSPAILLRSALPDPHGLIGARTFLHPTLIAAAVMPERIAGYSGAPQSVYCDHYLEQGPIDGPLGFKLEVPPIHPVLFATTLQGFGAEHGRTMSRFSHAHAMLALLRDGFHPASRGGKVGLRGDGSPVLEYPLDPVVWEGAKRALLTMAEIQFAAGAQTVFVVDERCRGYASWPEAREAIAALPLQPLLTRMVSAHVMGGCGMGADASKSVVDSRGRFHGLDGLSILDGSIFPTSVGANPQLSIYGIVARNASRLAADLTGRPAPEWGKME